MRDLDETIEAVVEGLDPGEGGSRCLSGLVRYGVLLGSLRSMALLPGCRQDDTPMGGCVAGWPRAESCLSSTG